MKLDIIGDIHGCFSEFEKLTLKLGYKWDRGMPVHPDGRILGFVGDLTDRGPKSLQVIETVWKLWKQELGYYVPGNHCNKLYRYFLGNNVQITHGLETTVEELGRLPEKDIERYKDMFIELYEKSPLYLQLDSGRLVIAHAGIKQEFIGKHNKRLKTFVLYGDITGETNEDGTPVRRDWAFNYKGEAYIVYGHTPFSEVRNINRTYNIDTGAVFGGKLSSISYPEMKVESVDSSMPYIAEKFRDVNPGK